MLSAFLLLLAVDSWQVRTFAGPIEGGGYADGPAREARFSGPSGVTSCGEAIFVADAQNHAIRRISRDQLVSTWAGRLTEAGAMDGVGGAARFRSPVGIASDVNCNLIVADRDNHAVRRIDTSGVVTTVAGALAGFKAPVDVAIDRDGTIWVADNGDRMIRHIGNDGQLIATIALPRSVVTSLGSPLGITLSPSGDLYIADVARLAVYRMNPASDITTVLSGVFAADVAFDASGSLFVVTGTENTVQRLGSDGTLVRIAGKPFPGSSDGQGSAASFYQLRSIALDVDGTFLLADELNCIIRKMTPAGEVTTVAGTAAGAGHVDGSGTDARFEGAADMDVDDEGAVWVADHTTLRRIALDGTVTTVAGMEGESTQVDGSRAEARFGTITGIAVESLGTLVVIDQMTVRRVTRDGTVSTIAGAAGVTGLRDGTGSSARFNALSGIAVAPDGAIYVTESLNGTVRKIIGNQVSTLASGYRVPMSVDVDHDGNVFLWCENDNSLYRFTPAGAVTVVATGPGGVLNGIALAPDGTVYIGGIYRHAIYRILPGATVAERFMGDEVAFGNVNGTAEQARFFSPTRLAVATDGRLFIRDLNRAIRVATKTVPPGPRRRPVRR